MLALDECRAHAGRGKNRSKRVSTLSRANDDGVVSLRSSHESNSEARYQKQSESNRNQVLRDSDGEVRDAQSPHEPDACLISAGRTGIPPIAPASDPSQTAAAPATAKHPPARAPLDAHRARPSYVPGANNRTSPELMRVLHPCIRESGSALRQRQPNLKTRIPGFGAHLNITAMLLHDSLYGVEAQAGSLPHGLGREEGLKNVGFDFG